MELTWNRGYEDYEDSAWPARKEYLTEIQQGLTPEKTAGLNIYELMDTLERMEELMRYYTVCRDLYSLESLMQSYEPLLERLRAEHPDTAGFWYLEMEYARLHALLCMNQNDNRQAVTRLEQALAHGERCFSCLQAEEDSFQEEQRLFLAWSCAECRNEMATACERILDSQKMHQVLVDSVPLLQYVESCLGDGDGICEKTAEFYSRIGGIHYQYSEFADGDRWYTHARELFEHLADKLHSDFYRARALMIYSLHGIDAFTRRGNTDIILACENEALQFLDSGAEGCSRSIAEGALAMIYMQRGTAIQQSGGSINDAVRWTEKSVDLFGNAQEALEKDSVHVENANAGNVLTDIAARLYSGSVAAMDVLGVQYYAAGRADEARGVFEEVLSMIANPGDYTLSESASLLIRSESCEYLALLSADGGDWKEADHYGTLAMDFSEKVAQATGDPAAWQIAAVSAALVSEIAERARNKPKMGAAAARGLAACDELERLTPGNGILSLRGNLIKREKKSKRRFF